MTAEELQEAERAYQADAGAADLSRTARNETIRRALADGWTHAQIADAIGLTRGRIGQLATAD